MIFDINKSLNYSKEFKVYFTIHFAGNFYLQRLRFEEVTIEKKRWCSSRGFKISRP